MDLNNATVAEYRDQVAYPFMMRSHNLYDSGRGGGEIGNYPFSSPLVSEHSLGPNRWGYLLSFAIYLSVKIFILDKHQQAEESLLQSEEKYRLLVSKLPALVFKGYTDWAVDFFDDKIEALTGYSKGRFRFPPPEMV